MTACARWSWIQIGCISTLTVVGGHIGEKYGPQKAPSCCTANEDILRHGDSQACCWAINYSFVAYICWKTWHLLGQSAAWRWAASTALCLSPSPPCFIHNPYNARSKWLTLNVLPSFYSWWKSSTLVFAASSVLSSLDVACSQICSNMFSWVRSHVGLYVFVEQPFVHALPVLLWVWCIMTEGVTT